jgi:hypothetical protein
VANDFHGPTYAIAGVLVIGLVVVVVRRRRAKAAPAPGARSAAFQPDGQGSWVSPGSPGSPGSHARVATGQAQARASGPYAPQDPWGPPPADYQPDPTGQYR